MRSLMRRSDAYRLSSGCGQFTMRGNGGGAVQVQLGLGYGNAMYDLSGLGTVSIGAIGGALLPLSIMRHCGTILMI